MKYIIHTLYVGTYVYTHCIYLGHWTVMSALSRLDVHHTMMEGKKTYLASVAGY